MSNNWYSSSWTGGTSGNSSNYDSNDNQSDGYEYGGQSFSIGNYGPNFSVNRGGFNLGYGATENSGNFRREYEPRYGEGAISNYRENYSHNFRGDEKRYGENTRNSDRSSTRGNYEQNYGENVRSTDRSTYEQRYGESDSSNDFRGGFKPSFGYHVGGTRGGFKPNFGYHAGGSRGSFGNHAGDGGFKPSFGDNTRGSHFGINYNGNERHIDSDWTGHYYSEDRVSENDEQRKVEESYSSKRSIKDEGLKSKKVKTEPYQNAYEKEYIEKDIKEETEPYQYEEFIEKDIKEERERIKSEVKEESFERDMIDKDLGIKQEVKLELDCTQEVAGGGFKVNNLKDNVDIKKELILKREMDIEKNEDLACNLGRLKEMTSQERVQNYATNQLKEEAFSDINVKKGIIKTEMDEKNVPENNEKPNIISKEESTNFAEIKSHEYACLKPECLATFQVWNQARSHMMQGCLPTKMTNKGCRLTVKPNLGQSREKAKKQREMGTSILKGVAAENEEKLVKAARNFYVERQNAGLCPTHTEVVWHLRNTYSGFGLSPARIHQIINSLLKQ